MTLVLRLPSGVFNFYRPDAANSFAQQAIGEFRCGLKLEQAEFPGDVQQNGKRTEPPASRSIHEYREDEYHSGYQDQHFWAFEVENHKKRVDAVQPDVFQYRPDYQKSGENVFA